MGQALKHIPRHWAEAVTISCGPGSCLNIMPTDKGKVCAFAFLYSSEKNGEATPPPSETTLEHDLSDIYRDSVEVRVPV